MYLCQKCKMNPVSFEDDICENCRKSMILSDSTDTSQAIKKISESDLSYKNSYVEGIVISCEQVSSQDGFGLRLLKAVYEGNRISTSNTMYHLQIRINDKTTVYVLLIGRLKGSYQIPIGHHLQVEGAYNRNRQFNASKIFDLSTGVTYKTASASYALACLWLLFHTCFIVLLGFLTFTLTQNIIFALLSSATYLTILFTAKKD